MLGAEVDQDAILLRLSNASIRRLRPVGTSSVVFEATLWGEVNAAYKPRSKLHPTGYLAEAAAYRLARCLNLDNVPPVVTRRLHRDEMSRRLHEDFLDAWGEIDAFVAWDDDQTVPGAAIYWLPAMRDLGMDREARVAQWTRALKVGANLPPSQRALHEDLSTMLAFDYLIANWDRMSGGNMQGVANGSRLFLRDHNLAFPAPLSPRLQDRVLGQLERTERFSRPFIEALVRLEESSFRDELARDPGAERTPLLTAEQIHGVMDRREALLSYVAALVQDHGEAAVFFP